MTQRAWVGIVIAAVAAGCSAGSPDGGGQDAAVIKPDVVTAQDVAAVQDVSRAPDVVDAPPGVDAFNDVPTIDIAPVLDSPDVRTMTEDVTIDTPINDSSCPSGEASCGGMCVNTNTNASHCGACNNACRAGLVCRQGTCVCPTSDETACGTGMSSVCVNTQRDNANCGRCGNLCPSSQRCEGGACACTPGQARCGDQCFDLQTDQNNCGACGQVCAAGRSCRGGRCECNTSSLTLCNNACVDLSADPMNCGMCGRTCPGGTACVAGNCGAPRVDAMYPSIVDRGDNNRVCIHGAFLPNSTVTFPGVTNPVIGTLTGGGQLCVDVPSEATAGPLSVRSGSVTVGPIPFRRTSFLMGLQPFRSRYEQTGYARQTPSLNEARAYAGSFEAGLYIYVVGGRGAGGGALRTIERAMINADGTLGVFGRFERELVTPREGPAVVRLGGYVYAIGGRRAGEALATVERAAIGGDGAVGAFETYSTTLQVARSGHATVAVGGYVYVMGGRGATDPLNTIERAPILPSGELGSFSTYRETLPAARADAALTVIGQSVCLFGGVGSARAVDCAPITNTGALSSFVSRGTLALAREGATATQLGGRVYVFGGRGSAPDSVDAADVSPSGNLSAFATSRSLTSLRRGATLVRVGNYVYLIGGEGSEPLATLERAQFIASGTVLQTCVVNGAIDAPRFEGTHVVIGNRIYILGGSTDPTVSSALVSAAGQLGSFQILSGANLRFERRGGAASVVGQQLCVTGGRPSGPSGWGSDTYCATIQSDASVGAFATDGTNIPNEYNGGQLAYMMPVVIDADLWIEGGNAGGTLHGYGLRRRPMAAWTLVPNAIEQGRFDASQVLLENNLYVVGGQDINMTRETVMRAQVINGIPSTLAIVPGLTLPRVQQAASSVVVGDRFITFGGQGGPRDVVASTINSDHTLGGFSALAMPMTCLDTNGSPGAELIDDNVYILGASQSATIQRFPLR